MVAVAEPKTDYLHELEEQIVSVRQQVEELKAAEAQRESNEELDRLTKNYKVSRYELYRFPREFRSTVAEIADYRYDEGYHEGKQIGTKDAEVLNRFNNYAALAVGFIVGLIVMGVIDALIAYF